ncbi:MAG: hypothetical protein HDQ91_03200 [Desulfovibrio sp.]|nr:hypothetical protein [Desulfovibrio sp.]
MSPEALLQTLTDYPYWTAGWKKLLGGLSEQEREVLTGAIYRLAPEPDIPMGGCRAAMALKDRRKARYWFNTASVFCRPETVYQDQAENQAAFAFAIGEPAIGKEYENWAKTSQRFYREKLGAFIADFARLARKLEIRPERTTPWAFALDFDPEKDNPYGGDAKNFNAPAYRKLRGCGNAFEFDPWPHYLAALASS